MKPAIFTFCFADIPYVLSAWQNCTRNNEIPIIFYQSKAHFDRICMISNAQNLQIPPSNLIQLNELESSLRYYHSIYLFTLGTSEIVNIILIAFRYNINVFYHDCYFEAEHQPLRLVNPLRHFFSRYRSTFCPPYICLKQVLCQLLYDPLRRNMYFSGDSHCWPTERLFKRLSQISISPLKLTPLFSLPPKSLLFTLNCTENDIAIDWNYFKATGYSLYYKPHPSPSNDYSCYPDYVAPIAANVDPGQISFTSSSFIVSFFSFSLASTKQSISLTAIYLNSVHPLMRLYVDKASHVPLDTAQLTSVLDQALLQSKNAEA